VNNRTHESYGQKQLTFVDHFGVWLTQRAIASELSGRSDLDVLELGCGYHAAHLRALDSHFRRAIGVDFQIAPELASDPRMTFHLGSIEEVLPRLAGDAFDVVLLVSVLEHLRQPEEVIAAIRNLLKPSGILLINVPTWRGKSWLEFSAFRLGLSPRLEIDDHKMYYDKRDLWPLLVRAGFKPSAIKLRYHKFGLNLFAVATRNDG